MKKNNFAIICSGASIVITILLYLLTFDNIFVVPMRCVSLLFLIFSEAIATYKTLNSKKTILGISTISTSIYHVALVLILSLIYINIFPLHIKSYILINLVLLCVLLIVDKGLMSFDHYISDKNEMLSKNQLVINALVEKASELVLKYKDTKYKKDLEEIYEILRYSDNTKLTNDEIIISNNLNELDNVLQDGQEDATDIIKNVKNNVEKRNVKLKSNNRGNY